MCFNGGGVWLELGLGGVIRFEKALTHTPYGGNYDNLRSIVVHLGAPVKSFSFQSCRFSSGRQLAGEENTA